jgi:hypothetical protein
MGGGGFKLEIIHSPDFSLRRPQRAPRNTKFTRNYLWKFAQSITYRHNTHLERIKCTGSTPKAASSSIPSPFNRELLSFKNGKRKTVNANGKR